MPALPRSASSIALAIAFAACGGGREAAPGAAGQAAAPAITATRASPEDVVVATVDGRPVWGSCVAAQAARGRLTRERALAECIDFELLAGVAHARQLGTAPEVREATRAALVNRLVEREVELRLDEPTTVKPILDAQLNRLSAHFDKAEARESAFVRVEVPETAAPERWDEAKRIADKIYAKLDGETGLFEVNLEEAAKPVRPETTLKVVVARFPLERSERIVPEFGRPLFAIPEVGRVAPPARTKWGYDIILLTAMTPAKKYTRDEVALEILPEARRQYFMHWVNSIVKQYGPIEIDQEQLQALEGL